MNPAQLNALKHGSNVFVKTKSQAECEGTLSGHLEEKRDVWLHNVKWYDGGEKAEPIYYDSLILPLECIEEIKLMDDSNEKAKDSQQKSLVKPEFGASVFNLFASRDSQLEWKQTKTTCAMQMQAFCKQLFENCNFTDLLKMHTKKDQRKVCIRLPSMYANILRQPKWFFDQTVNSTQQELTVVGAGDSVVNNADEKAMSSQLMKLNLNGALHNNATTYETIEIDLNKFHLNELCNSLQLKDTLKQDSQPM